MRHKQEAQGGLCATKAAPELSPPQLPPGAAVAPGKAQWTTQPVHSTHAPLTQASHHPVSELSPRVVQEVQA